MSWLEKTTGELGGLIDEYEFFKAQRHPEPEVTGWLKDVGEKVRDDSEAMPGPAAHSGPGGTLLQETQPIPPDHPLYRKRRRR